MTIHQSLQGSSCGHDGQLSGKWFRREDKGINTFKQRLDSVGTNGCSYVPAFASVLTIYQVVDENTISIRPMMDEDRRSSFACSTARKNQKTNQGVAIGGPPTTPNNAPLTSG